MTWPPVHSWKFEKESSKNPSTPEGQYQPAARPLTASDVVPRVVEEMLRLV
jgi:hypothetical protein